MKYLSSPKLLNTNATSNYICKFAFGFITLKLLFIVLFIGFALGIKAQIRTITICAGEEVVLSNFSLPPEPKSIIPQGPNQPTIRCNYDLRSILKPSNLGLVRSDENSFTVAPLFTTVYWVESNYILVNGPTFPETGNVCETPNFYITSFEIIVEDCLNTSCDLTDPFNELPWLNELINMQDENNLGYSDYTKLYNVDDNSYFEVFSELTGNSKIYTCDGMLYCERINNLACDEFNEDNLTNILYYTTCTSSSAEMNPEDNKVDLEIVKYIYLAQLEREEIRDFNFKVINNGPCNLYETDIVIEVNGEIIGIEHLDRKTTAGWNFTVKNTELTYNFKADTDYTVKIYPLNPNGNKDLNFANDTLTTHYESFESLYDFRIKQFVPISPSSNDTILPVNIILDNFSNAKPSEIYIHWSVNGEEQEPLKKEEFAYNLEPASFWDKVSKNDTIEIGNYLFETGESYLIEAWVDLPPEIRDETQPQDLDIYFLTLNSVNIDLAITGLNKPFYEKIDRSGEIHAEIINKSNVEIDEFTINWFINDVAQTPINIQNPDWETQTNNFLFDGKVSIPIGTLNIEGNLDYELRFEIETPIEYPDSNLANNSYTFSYKSDQKKYYDADLYLEVCKGDSAVLSVKEFSRSFPYTPGGAESGIYCDISFFNKRWTLDGALLDTTLAITVKPTADALYVFSSDTYGDCTNSNCSGASTQRDIKELY